MADAPDDPRLVDAKILKYQAEAETLKALALTRADEASFFRAQARKVGAEADLTELSYTQLQRDHDRENLDNDENRILDFTHAVTESTTETAMRQLARWRRESKEPITLRFTSPGGNVISGLALFDYIQSVRADGIHVTTCTLGMAASMASILLQAGDVRVIGEHAHVLIHEVSASTGGKIGEMEDDTKFYHALNKRLFGILAARSKMGVGAIESRAKRRDWWLDSTEVMRKGFADRIGYQ